MVHKTLFQRNRDYEYFIQVFGPNILPLNFHAFPFHEIPLTFQCFKKIKTFFTPIFLLQNMKSKISLLYQREVKQILDVLMTKHFKYYNQIKYVLQTQTTND